MLCKISRGESKGLIGYSVMAKFLRRRFWTLSVWEDEKALMEFVTNVPHKDIMISLKGMLTDTKFVRWRILGSAVPPSWEEAFTRLQKE